MRLCCTAVLLVLLVGCGTASRVVRLDTGQTETIVFTQRSGAEPVVLDSNEFKKAVAKLVRGTQLPTRPHEAARRLFEVNSRSGSYTYETRSHHIVPNELGEHLEGAATAVEVEMTRDYLRWCERTGRPGDCLRLLTESPTVNGDGRFALAMALAKGAVLDEMLEASTTFNELREAGERYGKVMGRNAARAFAMLATAAIGNTASGLATTVPKLPGSVLAAAQAETQVGIRLAAVGEKEPGCNGPSTLRVLR